MMTIIRKFRFASAALMLGTAVAAIVPAPATAQESQSSIRGRITPPVGSTVSSVTITNVETNEQRNVTTGTDGAYNIPSLRPGYYRLTIQLSDTVRNTDTFQLLVGQRAVLDIDLTQADPAGPASAEADRDTPPPNDAIVVTSNRIRTLEGGEVGVNITERTIETLPQTNRNFLAFADLAPGVQYVTGANGQTSLRAGAQDASAINVFIDGISQKDLILKNGITGQDSTPGNPFPQLAIGEYRVISSNYKAEFDQVSSAAVTAVTKSGTNTFSGNAFFDFSNTDLRSSTPLERDRDTKAETRDMQFGAALGGPIIRDRLFFFGSYEGKRIQRPVDVVAGGGLDIGAYPQQYQDSFGSFNERFDEDLYFGKLSWLPSDEDLFEATVKVRRERGQSFGGGQLIFEASSLLQVDETRALLRYQRTNDDFVNDAKVSYQNVSWSPRPLNFQPGLLYQTANPGAQTLLIAGGSPNFQDKGQKGFTVQDDFTWIGFERHTIKVGAKASWIELNTLERNFFNPRFTFNAQYDPANDAVIATPGFYNLDYPYSVTLSASVAGGADPTGLVSHNFQFGAYVQDDWEVTDRLTLNLGIRWDYEHVPAYLDFVTPADALAAVSPANYPNLQNANYDISDYISDGTQRSTFTGAFQPRLGFSYFVDEDRQAQLFGGFGRSYSRNQFDYLQQELTANAFRQLTYRFQVPGDTVNDCVPSVTCVAFDPSYLTSEGLSQLVQSTGGAGRTLRFVDNDLKTPYADQYSLGLRTRLDALLVEVGYNRNEARDGFAYLLGNRRPNGAFFAPGTVTGAPFGFAPSGFGSILLGVNGIKSNSDAVYVKLEKNYTASSPWSLNLTYTFTRAETNRAFGEYFSFDYPTLDDYPVLFSAGAPRHRIVAAGSVDAPLGFLLSGKVTLASPPFVYGFGANGPAVIEGDNFNPFIFGDAWAQRQIDLALTKYVAMPFISDASRLRFRVDVLNVLDTANFTNYNGNANDDTRTEASPTIFGELAGLGTGGFPPRTVKLSVGYSF